MPRCILAPEPFLRLNDALVILVVVAVFLCSFRTIK